MMKSNNNEAQERRQVDRFLVGIVAGVTTLIVVALILVWRTPAVPEYQSEDAPEGVAVNYLLALQREEYERAYGYLAPDLPGYPADAGTFLTEVRGRWCFEKRDSSNSLRVEDVDVVGEQAVVTIVETVYDTRPSLFSNNRYTREVTVSLKQIDGRWYVRESDRCWSFEWSNENE